MIENFWILKFWPLKYTVFINSMRSLFTITFWLFILLFAYYRLNPVYRHTSINVSLTRFCRIIMNYVALNVSLRLNNLVWAFDLLLSFAMHEMQFMTLFIAARDQLVRKNSKFLSCIERVIWLSTEKLRVASYLRWNTI